MPEHDPQGRVDTSGGHGVERIGRYGVLSLIDHGGTDGSRRARDRVPHAGAR